MQVLNILICILTIGAQFLISERVHLKTLSDHNQMSPLIISINYTSSVVEYQYRDQDDSLKSWNLFYDQNIQIFRSAVFGEIVLGQPIYRFTCFMLSLDGNNVVPFKAFDKLNQTYLKNKQEADTELALQFYLLDSSILKSQLQDYGNEVFKSCFEASEVYTTRKDIMKIAERNKNFNLLSTVKFLNNQPSLSLSQFPYCHSAPPDWSPSCLCVTSISINWYPCSYKTCQSENGEKSVCGIESCKQTHRFVYLVEKLKLCF
ncbi:out at first protein homolog [Hydractinia symbiolongicarpus]|uniref:out at first protein homolog n=1 Tax=Hydractinia symbiolongicarpus TaxID=13093 RepID=UPI00254D2FC0|nr:out at first protein homolog [Hydractinia symbiolongicarpus]